MSLAAFERKIVQLEAEMAAAVTREDYETAARLRDEIVSLKGGGMVRKPPPGEMGLGTNVPVVAPPKGWTKPKKPNLMTNVKGRKR
jgi:hypothetical protein